MTRSGRHNEDKSRKDAIFSHDNCYEGTAARTRPLSCDEIMRRRKNKKLSEDVEVGPAEANALPMGKVGENGSNSSDLGRSKRKSISDTEKCVLEDTLKVISTKKRENTLKEGNGDKGKDRKDNTVRRMDREDITVKRKDRDNITVKGKDRENHETVIKLKDKPKNDYVSKAKEGIDNQIQGRRKTDEDLSHVSVKETEKRYLRDFAGKDKYSDRNRGEPKRENTKRRYRDEDNETNRDRITVKKHEPGRHRNYEISERKEIKESSRSHYEGSRSKRRRSRSREHEKDKNRKSTSASPKDHKRTFHYRREHGDTTSHTLKERSRTQLSDVDRGRIPSNGSSSHYRRHDGFTSGLGGYSPRKRKSEAAIRTPSPIPRSPEKKNVGWDFPPIDTDSKLTSSVLPTLSSPNQSVFSKVGESEKTVPVAISSKKGSPDSVQLTQATWPMRRLYIDNVPASATEKAIMTCLNDFLLSLDVNHIHGGHPCISCIIQKEKGQAVVEFRSPEDASAALSFDGSSFSGSILNIRRPEDFVDVATGDLDKSVAAVDTINDSVKDSSQKIFVGGISKTLSSKMVMEIVSAFGPLKAYRFEVDHGQPCAFLEYVDQSVTLKACAGLSGMKIGGQVLSAVQSVPQASSLENSHKTSSYGIPAHAKPLLKQPTRVLKLKNVFIADALSLLAESEVEELLEDIQLECSRFGAVKSINVVKQSSSPIASPKVTENVGPTMCFHNSEDKDRNAKPENSIDVVDHEPGVNIEESSGGSTKEIEKAVNGEGIDGMDDHEDVKPPEESIHMAAQELACESIPERNSPQHPSQINTLKDYPADTELDLENKLETKGDMGTDEKSKEDTVGSYEIAAGATQKVDNEKSDLKPLFERGNVLVEFRRTEASCMAAHSLHGRTFGDHIVAVEFVKVDLYKARFPTK